MRYIIFGENNMILIENETEHARLMVDTERISIYEVLKILRENAVDPCHVQNVYDDLINR